MKINSLIQKNVQKPFLVVFILFLICVSVVRHQTPIEENFLDGCYHVYLDVGSNIGVQVRKLFQPKEYPNAPALEVFKKSFGE